VGDEFSQDAQPSHCRQRSGKAAPKEAGLDLARAPILSAVRSRSGRVRVAESSSIGARQFVEGIGGRLSASKSSTYEHGVLAIEARNNPFIGKYMLAGDLACVLSAHELGITPRPDAAKLAACLVELLPMAAQLSRDHSIGDIVVSRELWIVETVGQDVGAWLHVGRNRAESLRGSLPRMFFRDALHREFVALQRLVRALVDRAEPEFTSLAPFYHHLQHAGRTSLGEYLLSWAASFNKHFDRLLQADDRLDLAPPPNCGRPIVVDLINRMGRRLGFSKVGKIWQELFITEEHFSEPAFVLVQISVGLARLAEDLRLFMTSEFDFFELADEHASGSSGRPQKKNPFGLQAVIGGATAGSAHLMQQFAANITVSEEADSTYHAYHLYEHAHDVIAWTELMADVIEKGQFKLQELESKSKLGFAGAREALDILVYEHRVPYRFAHRVCGELVRLGSSGVAQEALTATVAERLKEFPEIDATRLVRVATGEATDAIMLNLTAFREVHAEIRANLNSIAAQTRANPVAVAIENLLAEGRSLAQ
jgi:argininosuccinate lyase